VLKHPSLFVFLKIPSVCQMIIGSAWIVSYLSKSYHKSLWLKVNRFMMLVNRIILLWIVSSNCRTITELIHTDSESIQTLHLGSLNRLKLHIICINLHSLSFPQDLSVSCLNWFTFLVNWFTLFVVCENYASLPPYYINPSRHNS